MSEKISVGILGAAGTVGQRFVQLLAEHPWFEIKALAGSDRSTGKRYDETCQWRLEGSIPENAKGMVVQPLTTDLPVQLVFSALPSTVAKAIEPQFAQAGIAVCSNSSAYRFVEDVPLLIPEVNGGHVSLIKAQQQNRGWRGFIATSPNCTTTGIAIPLRPLQASFGIEQVTAFSMQAISGAGYPGVASTDIVDNVVPHIPGEEEKIELETRLLLGTIVDGKKKPQCFPVSAQANRVNVIDGHTCRLSIKLRNKAEPADVLECLKSYAVESELQALPSAPEELLFIHEKDGRPQPRLDRNTNNGMSIHIGHVEKCPVNDIKMTTVSHNTMRGAAGGAILNAEYLKIKGYL